MDCPQCGYAQAPPGARFCPSCGQTLPQPPAPVTQIQVTQPVEHVEDGGTVTGVSIGRVIGTVVIAADEQTEARRRRDLRILLNKVKEFWVDGVLQRSVQGAGLIELDKTLQPEAVEQPWEGTVPGAEPAALALPPGKAIADVFHELDHALLVLDGAGAGKTISLLELARQTIGRAERDPLQPVPVVLNLSSWTQSRQSIAGWAVEELNARYQIPTRLGRQWLEDNLIALLLDGLDEVKPERLPACIAALNQFRQDHGLVQIGICCRTQDYQTAGARLKLSGAILLQPLTAGQIEGYLAAAGPRAEALRTVLQGDVTLQALAHSPLMLNMMRLAYQDVPRERLSSEPLDTPEERRGLLLQRYVDRMFQVVAGTSLERHSRGQTCLWLAWLAQGMARHNLSVFLIEGLQPSWLPGRAHRWIYALLTRILAGLVLALGSVAWGYLLPDLRAPAWGYLLVGAAGGLVMGLADALRFEPGRQDKQAGAGPERGPGHRLRDLLGFLLSAGMIWAAIYLLRWTGGWIFGLKEGLMFGLMFGLILGVRNRAGGAGRDTETVDALAWAPAGSFRGALAGLGVSLVMATAYGAVAGLTLGRPEAPRSASIFLAIFGPTLALIGSILGGLRGTLVETKTLPNQGLWLSARNALLVGLAVGLAGGLGEGLTNIVIGRVLGVSSAGLGIMLVGGLFWAIVAALWYGGLDLIKHFTLRAILWLAGYAPWKYVEFLDYAVERSFLQRAGGGYLFANRLVQEYFAESGGNGDRNTSS